MAWTSSAPRVDAWSATSTSSERAEGVERIWMPGEIEHYRRIDRERDGIPLPPALVEEIDAFAAELGCSPLTPLP